MVNAICSGNFEKLLYLKEHHLDVGVDEAVVKEIVWICSFEIFGWFCANYPEHFISKATVREWIEGSDWFGMCGMYFQFQSSSSDP